MNPATSSFWQLQNQCYRSSTSSATARLQCRCRLLLFFSRAAHFNGLTRNSSHRCSSVRSVHYSSYSSSTSPHRSALFSSFITPSFSPPLKHFENARFPLSNGSSGSGGRYLHQHQLDRRSTRPRQRRRGVGRRARQENSSHPPGEYTSHRSNGGHSHNHNKNSSSGSGDTSSRLHHDNWLRHAGVKRKEEEQGMRKPVEKREVGIPIQKNNNSNPYHNNNTNDNDDDDDDDDSSSVRARNGAVQPSTRGATPGPEERKKGLARSARRQGIQNSSFAHGRRSHQLNKNRGKKGSPSSYHTTSGKKRNDSFSFSVLQEIIQRDRRKLKNIETLTSDSACNTTSSISSTTSRVEYLYGLHSVLNVLRQFLSPSFASASAFLSSSPPFSYHPHRRAVVTLYVRDFSGEFKAVQQTAGTGSVDGGDERIGLDAVNECSPVFSSQTVSSLDDHLARIPARCVELRQVVRLAYAVQQEEEEKRKKREQKETGKLGNEKGRTSNAGQKDERSDTGDDLLMNDVSVSSSPCLSMMQSSSGGLGGDFLSLFSIEYLPRPLLRGLCGGDRRHQNVVLAVSPFQPIPVDSFQQAWTIMAQRETFLKTLVRPHKDRPNHMHGYHHHLAHSDTNERKMKGNSSNNEDGIVMRSNSSRRDNSAAKPLVLYLHDLLDPVNVGGVARGAYCYGVDYLLLSPSSCTVSPSVSRASAGLVEHLLVFRVKGGRRGGRTNDAVQEEDGEKEDTPRGGRAREEVMRHSVKERESNSCSSCVGSATCAFLRGAKETCQKCQDGVFNNELEEEVEQKLEGSHSSFSSFSSPATLSYCLKYPSRVEVIGTTPTPFSSNINNNNNNSNNVYDVKMNRMKGMTTYDGHSRDGSDAPLSSSTSSSHSSVCRLLVLGSERRGLESEVLQECTSLYHVPSPRQLQLAREEKEEEEEDTKEEDAHQRSQSDALHSLGRVHSSEVSLNVHVACTVMLSQLCESREKGWWL